MNIATTVRQGTGPASDESHLDRLATRRSIPPARLVAPGPSADELRMILTIAARVPDHGALTPWRFLVVDKGARVVLAERLAETCLATAGETADAKEQAQRTAQKLRLLFGQPPLVVVVVSSPRPDTKIPIQEQVLSAGAACMNLIAAATMLGYGTNWLTGWAAANPAARPILGLRDGESVAGVIPVGTPNERATDRPRPDLSEIVRVWSP